MRPLSRKESREVDDAATRRLGIPSICLMENAGAGAARVAKGMLRPGAGVLCVCGPGGNGGDGLVVARHLAIDGVPVRAIAWGRQPRGDTAVQLAICAAMRIPLDATDASADFARILSACPPDTLIVDGLYGTGLERAIEGAAAEVVAAINASRLPVLALDVPSGLDCDSGRPLGACVRATRTATFAAPKIGFSDPASRAWTGEVTVVPIGAPPEPAPPD